MALPADACNSSQTSNFVSLPPAECVGEELAWNTKEKTVNGWALSSADKRPT